MHIKSLAWRVLDEICFPSSQGAQNMLAILKIFNMSELLSCFHGAENSSRHSFYSCFQLSTLWQPKHAKCSLLLVTCNIMSVSFQTMGKENQHFNPGLWVSCTRTVSWVCYSCWREMRPKCITHTHTHTRLNLFKGSYKKKEETLGEFYTTMQRFISEIF